MGLNIYNSKRKNAADNRMTDMDITDRFKDDDEYNEGDWGKASKKYASGPTYDQEMKNNPIIENESFMLKSVLDEAQIFEVRKKLSQEHYAIIGDPKHLFVNSAADKHWVMDRVGSIHKHPFFTAQQAQSYMKNRQSAVHEAKIFEDQMFEIYLGTGEPTGFRKPLKNWYQVFVHSDNIIGYGEKNNAQHELKKIHSCGSFEEAKKKAIEAHKQTGHHVDVFNSVTHQVVYPEKGTRLKHKLDETNKVEPWDKDHPGLVQAELPLTHCPVCGKTGHPAASHFGRALAPENNQSVTKPVKEDEIKGNDKAEKCPDCGKEHAPTVPCPKKKVLIEPPCSTDPVSRFDDLKKQKFNVLMEPEVSEDELTDKLDDAKREHQAATRLHIKHFINNPKKAAIYKKEMKNTTKGIQRLAHAAAASKANIGKKPNLPESVNEEMKMSHQHDTPEAAEAHKNSLVKQGKKAWIKHSPDNKHHVFWMVKEEEKSLDEVVKKPKKFDKLAHVRAMARKVVGQPKKTQVILPKKDRKPKHKKQHQVDDPWNPFEEKYW